jgi:hypothetical protein
VNINVYGSSLCAWTAAACLSEAGNNVSVCEVLLDEEKELGEISVIRD